MSTAWNLGPVLQPDGSDARADAALAWVLLGGGLALWLGVMALLLWAVTRDARPGPHAGAARDGQQGRAVRPARWIVGGGLLLPLLVLGALQLANLRQLRRLGLAPAPGLPLVAVTAREWWWQLRLMDGSGRSALLANELVLPVGRPVRLGLSSERLIHSLWVPALAGKVDLVPGRVGQLVLQAERAGAWRGPCAEFCGQGHSRMVLRVVAVPPAEWAAWWQRQLQPAAPPADALARRGLALFEQRRCSVCHAVRGLGSRAGPEAEADSGDGPLGPDLTHLASRSALGAGTLPNTEAGLRAWLGGVQRHKPGAAMPEPALDADTLDALVAFLRGLH